MNDQFMRIEKWDRYRVLGFSLGLAILGSVFLLPFTYRGARPLTLYEVAGIIAEFWQEISQSASQTVALNCVLGAAFVLLVFAGLVGAIPLISGLTGVSTMAVTSSVLFLTWPQAVLGSGYYVVWIASLATLCVGVWRRYS
ncbi:MAG: hypothetical protein Q8O47_06975 [Candidatus Bathyarchaeota archaeon]|nr:hypothetical protein [Candidatus Bathyarchaeota archaeon]